MAKITQYSRISHHTLTTPGVAFSSPISQDFTDGTWTPSDLALSEIGVNEADKRAFLRIDNEIKEFVLTGLNTTVGVDNSIGSNYRLFTIGNSAASRSFMFNTLNTTTSGSFPIMEIPLSLINSRPGPISFRFTLSAYTMVSMTMRAYSVVLSGLFAGTTQVGTLSSDVKNNITTSTLAVNITTVGGAIVFNVNSTNAINIDWECCLEVNR